MLDKEKIDGAFVSVIIPVQWGDMDAAQHVNNTIYLKWVETARLAFFEKLLQGEPDFKGVGPILSWQDCKYIFPVTYPDTVMVTHDVISVEQDRLQCSSSLYSTTHQRLVAKAKTTLVAYDYNALKKAPIPESWVSVLDKFYKKN